VTLAIRAPGKVILLGEYAVLEGAPALVAAVARHATCVVREGEGCRVEGAGSACARGEPAPRTDDPLAFARAALAAVDFPDGLYRLDSEDLALRDARGERHKLGLGGSAATLVALLGAAFVRSGRPLDPGAVYALAQRVHHGVQGRGSGADVAASAFGGLIAYRWLEGRREAGLDAGCGTGVVRRIDAAPLPALWLAWTGRAASTPALVRRVDELRRADPARHAALLAPIAAASAAAIDAIDDRAALTAAAAGTTAALVALGAAAGVPLRTPVHEALASLAHPYGAVVKPTGAGGGDLAWIVAADEEREAAAAAAIQGAGHPVLRLAIDPRGVREG
jgi:phosphomevalonate kinase